MVPLTLDVTNAEQIQRAASEIDTLDVLINNAGISIPDDLSKPELIEQHLAVNLFGSLNMTRAFLPRLKRPKGAIVNNISTVALAPLAIIPGYSISKAAALSMTQSLKVLLASQGVTVHAILTGPVDTDMTRGINYPKASPESAAVAIFDGIEKGEEEIFPDPLSQSIAERWHNGAAKALERLSAAFVPETVVGQNSRAWRRDRGHNEVQDLTKGEEKLTSQTTSNTGTREKGQLAMNTPPIVSQQEWEAARQQLLVKEKVLTSARHAMAAQRRRMPWIAVDKNYEFDGLNGKASLLGLFEGRRQLVIYRAFFEPGVFGWPDHACRGCSLGADQVAHLAHLNVRDTTLAYASRAPQADIARLKARMGWEMPWYTITDSFDADFGVDEWYGYNAFIRGDDKVFRTYFINGREAEAMGTTWSYLDMTALGRQETWEDSPEGYPQDPPHEWLNWHDNYDAEPTPNPLWLDMLTDPEGAAIRRREAEEKKCNCE